jgi:hypothetical protein
MKAGRDFCRPLWLLLLSASLRRPLLLPGAAAMHHSASHRRLGQAFLHLLMRLRLLDACKVSSEAQQLLFIT